MAKITQERKNKLEAERKRVRELKREAAKAKAAAVALGDLSENEEYSAALRTLTAAIVKEQQIEDTLAGCIVVSENTGPRITIGSRLEVQKLDKNNQPEGESLILTLEDEGDPIQQQTLGVGSALGKAILNGTSGIYTIAANGGIVYKVTKLIGKAN